MQFKTAGYKCVYESRKDNESQWIVVQDLMHIAMEQEMSGAGHSATRALKSCQFMEDARNQCMLCGIDAIHQTAGERCSSKRQIVLRSGSHCCGGMNSGGT